MANEKVSQMTPLTAAELAVDDVFLITDTSQKQSKKISTADLLTYIEATGSFNATTATNATSASHVPGTGVEGTVVSASHANFADTASFALNVVGIGGLITGSLVPITSSVAITSSFAKTASFVNSTATASFVVLAKSASFLQFTPGTTNGTASFALSASQASTASFIVSSSHANNADTASISTSASFAATASYFDSASLGSGIFSYGSVVSAKPQSGPVGATPSFPVDIFNLSASLLVHSINSKFLINMNVQVGMGTGNVGITGVALWKSSSVSDASILRCINGMTINEASALDGLFSVSATYIDIPNLTPGTQVIYRGRAFNNFGNLLINTSGGGGLLGTSSLSVVEFV